MNTLERRQLIESTNGGIFSARFLKKSGELREINCRLKVRKHLRGGVSTTSHKENLITVWDLKAEGYRNINLETLLLVKFGGKEIIV